MILNPQLIILALLFLWLLILTILFWTMSSHYNNLTRGVSSKTLKGVLESFMSEFNIAQKDIDFLRDRCDKIEQEGLLNIQKVGLLRFNPFKDTGGDQSFVLALTDANDTGVVISGLYSRSGTRWYAKRVVNGRGVEHKLSDEEAKVVKEAKKANN